MSKANHHRRRKRRRSSGGSNEGRWVPYVAADERRPQPQGFQQDHPQQMNPHVPAPAAPIGLALEMAYSTLFSLIDYSSLAQGPPPFHNGVLPRHEILADSLNYIEHLENVPVSRGARDSLSYALNKELKCRVPEQYFVDAGVQRQRFRVQAFVPSPLSVAQAVIEWIKDLKVRNERELNDQKRMKMKQGEFEDGEIASIDEDRLGQAKDLEEHTSKSVEDGTGSSETERADSTNSSEATRFAKSRSERMATENAREADKGAIGIQDGMEESDSESQQRVDNFMDKMERWIGLWQAGKLRDEDWNTMKDCMELPD